jgi:PAS domain S-box-containing protein
MDKSLGYTYWNKASENLTGVLAKDAVGKSLYELFPDVKGTKAEEVYLEVLRTGQSKSFINEYALFGKRFIFEISAYPTRQGIAVFTRDITEHAQMETNLRESEERFRILVEAAPSLLMITDIEGRNAYVSPNCEEITGYTRDELLGKIVWWVHEDDSARAKAIFDRVFHEGIGGANFEYKAVRKNGEVWYASSSWNAIRVGGRFEGVVFQTIDVKERKNVEEDRDRLFKAVEIAKEAVSIQSPHLTTVYANEAMCELFGYRREELIGKHVSILNADAMSEATTKQIVGAIERDGYWEGEVHNRRKDGSEFVTYATTTVIKTKMAR